MKGFESIRGPGGYQEFHKKKTKAKSEPRLKSEFAVAEKHPNGRIKKMVRKEAVIDSATKSAIEEIGPKTEEQRSALVKAILLTGTLVFGSAYFKDANDSDSDREQVKSSTFNNFQIPQPETSSEQDDYLEPDYKIYNQETTEKQDAFDVAVSEHVEEMEPYDLALTKVNADKSVVGAEEFTREEYVEKKIKFEESVPKIVQEELRRLMPALAATESRFDPSRVSSDGAEGILQILPKNWTHYEGEPGREKFLVDQVEVAGEFISDLYNQIQYYVGKENLRVLQSYTEGEESFQRDVMVPLVINSYNTGAERMSKAVNLYLENTSPEDIPEGKELYLAIVDYAKKSGIGFGEDSSEYTAKVFARAEKSVEADRDENKRG